MNQDFTVHSIELGPLIAIHYETQESEDMIHIPWSEYQSLTGLSPLSDLEEDLLTYDMIYGMRDYRLAYKLGTFLTTSNNREWWDHYLLMSAHLWWRINHNFDDTSFEPRGEYSIENYTSISFVIYSHVKGNVFLPNLQGGLDPFIVIPFYSYSGKFIMINDIQTLLTLKSIKDETTD